jgi:hypothetical protein
MCTVTVHVRSVIVLLYTRDSKLTILIYNGVRHSELILSGAGIEVLKDFMSWNFGITGSWDTNFASFETQNVHYAVYNKLLCTVLLKWDKTRHIYRRTANCSELGQTGASVNGNGMGIDCEGWVCYWKVSENIFCASKLLLKSPCQPVCGNINHFNYVPYIWKCKAILEGKWDSLISCCVHICVIL